MPKFDYKCKKCGYVVELDEPDLKVIVHHKKDGTPVKEETHPDMMCDGMFKRVYSFAGSVLKGSGWYSVDKRKTDGGTIGV